MKTNLNFHYQLLLHACFSWNCSGAKEFLKTMTLVSTISLKSPLMWDLSFICKDSNFLHPSTILPSLLESGRVVLERKSKTWNVYTDRQTGQQVIRSFQLRRAIHKALQILTAKQDYQGDDVNLAAISITNRSNLVDLTSSILKYYHFLNSVTLRFSEQA